MPHHHKRLNVRNLVLILGSVTALLGVLSPIAMKIIDAQILKMKYEMYARYGYNPDEEKNK